MATEWSQLEGESNKAYQAFLYYIETRATTQLEAYLAYCEWNWDRARREAEEETKNEPPGWFKRWPSQFLWSKRRDAYYAHIDERALQKVSEGKIARKVERLEMLDKFATIVDELGPGFLRKAFEDGEMSVREFVALIDKLMRNYRDELDDNPTERHEVEGEVTYRLNLPWEDD